MQISLCMIVKDEEQFLDKCIKSVKDYVDEIIIVDTGSKDKTKEVAKKYTKKVYDFAWTNDFSKARNFSLSKATKDWILVLDADEIISKNDLKKIRELVKNTEHDSFYLIQRNYTNDNLRHNWTPVEKDKYSKNYKGYCKNPIIRLFKKGIKYSGALHEVVDKSVKNPGKTEIAIHHYYEDKSLKDRQLRYLQIAEAALRKKPDARLYSSAAAIYLYFKKDYKKAISYFKKSVDLGYKKNQNLEGIAEAYLRLKEFEKAYQIYKKLAKENYLTPTLCNNLANLLIMYKHYKGGLKFLKLALAKGNPNKERIEKNIEAVENILKK